MDQKSLTNRGIELTLPFPPSANQIWRRVGRRTLLSRKARLFRQRVLLILAPLRIQPVQGSLLVEIDIHPPDRRKRDLDNLPKAILDAIQHARVYEDDCRVDKLIVTRCTLVKGGKAVVRIRPLEPDMAQGTGGSSK